MLSVDLVLEGTQCLKGVIKIILHLSRLLAIMLGRLRMSIDDATRTILEFCKHVYSSDCKPKQRRRIGKEFLTSLLRQMGMSKNEPLIEPDPICKVYII